MAETEKNEAGKRGVPASNEEDKPAKGPMLMAEAKEAAAKLALEQAAAATGIKA